MSSQLVGTANFEFDPIPNPAWQAAYGFTLKASGELDGTPNDASCVKSIQPLQATLKISDQSGSEQLKAIDITVLAPDPILNAIPANAIPAAVSGERYQFNVAPYVQNPQQAELTYSLNGVSSFTIDANGMISGRPGKDDVQASRQTVDGLSVTPLISLQFQSDNHDGTTYPVGTVIKLKILGKGPTRTNEPFPTTLNFLRNTPIQSLLLKEYFEDTDAEQNSNPLEFSIEVLSTGSPWSIPAGLVQHTHTHTLPAGANVYTWHTHKRTIHVFFFLLLDRTSTRRTAFSAERPPRR